jgi:tRNA (guanine-N7-)-methyltransferase
MDVQARAPTVAASSSTPGRSPRAVRSFVRREGRMTQGQRRALARCWARYGIDRGDSHCDFDQIFGRHAPRVLEIGFGMGDSLAAMAEAHPQDDYIGIEVYRPGIGHLLRRLDELGLENVRVIAGDAAEVIKEMIPDATFDAVFILFPDPWPKKRHHKRRLIQPAFVAELARVLKDSARLYMATDWEDYAAQMLAIVESAGYFVNDAGEGRCAERPVWRAVTKFEHRGRGQGRAIRDLQFSRKARIPSNPE